MQKYNILELNEKSVEELKSIAGELKIKKISSLRKEELIYAILDQQAINFADQTATQNKEREDRTGQRGKKNTPKKQEVPVKKTEKQDEPVKVIPKEKGGGLRPNRKLPLNRRKLLQRRWQNRLLKTSASGYRKRNRRQYLLPVNLPYSPGLRRKNRFRQFPKQQKHLSLMWQLKRPIVRKG